MNNSQMNKKFIKKIKKKKPKKKKNLPLNKLEE